MVYQLICGDALAELKKLDSDSVHCVITSPPYPGVLMWGELYKPENFNKAHEFLSQVWDECLRVLKPGCKLCINIANTKRRPYLPNTHKIYEWAEDKCEALGEIIWVKGYGSLGTAWGSYANASDISLADQHEYIQIFRKFGKRVHRSGYTIHPRDFKSWRNSIWQIPPAKASKENHIAPFPPEIPRRLILLYTYEGETVLDPFCGSGTTGVEAINCSRNFIGIDHNKEYIKLSKQNVDAQKSQLLLYREDVRRIRDKVKASKLF